MKTSDRCNILHPDKLEAFTAWLKQQPKCWILPVKGEHEVLRFYTDKGTGLIHKNSWHKCLTSHGISTGYVRAYLKSIGHQFREQGELF